MLDFTSVKRGERTMQDLAAALTLDDLRRLTEESVAALEILLDGLEDADVVFVPDDPDALDAAADPAERHLPWTLEHVIVHTTASGEEYAAVAREFARGVRGQGESRPLAPPASACLEGGPGSGSRARR